MHVARGVVRTSTRASGELRRTLASTTSRGSLPNVVFVDGVRTPFLTSGTNFNDYIAQDLARFAIKGLMTKTALDPSVPDKVILGTVIQEVRTSNIAREACLGAGLPDSIAAHTVTMACISSNAAIADGAALLQSGHAGVVIAGGAETMSDVPIRFSRPLRKRLLKATKVKSPAGYLQLLKGLSAKDLAPEAPAIAEFSTNETMGQSSDRLAARWGVTREEQDIYALESHRKAAAATEKGLLRPEIVAVDGITSDNGVRGDAELSKLASLKPAFVKPHGTHTAGNSSFLTDGAAAALFTTEARAKELGLEARSVLRDWIFVAQDPREELLLGPAYAIARLLHRHSLKIDDIDVVELHEAFAGQVLSNLNALKDASFCKDKAGVPNTVGAIDPARINAWGGALAIGHPFGATGTRLYTTATNRLQAGKGKYAIIAACAAGGQGMAMLLEKP